MAIYGSFLFLLSTFSTNSAQNVFNSSWSYFSLAPVDTTIYIQFDGSVGQNFYSFRNQSRHVQSIIDSYTIWYNNGGSRNPALKPFSPKTGTSTMYDVLAVFLAASYPSVLTMANQELSLIITDEGFSLINSTFGKPVNVSV